MNNLIYVASAYAGDVKENSERAKRYCVHVINEGGIPIAPHLLFTQFLDDSVPHERKLGLDLGLELLEHCGEVWVFGDISKGMERERTPCVWQSSARESQGSPLPGSWPSGTTSPSTKPVTARAGTFTPWKRPMAGAATSSMRAPSTCLPRPFPCTGRSAASWGWISTARAPSRSTRPSTSAAPTPLTSPRRMPGGTVPAAASRSEAPQRRASRRFCRPAPRPPRKTAIRSRSLRSRIEPGPLRRSATSSCCRGSPRSAGATPIRRPACRPAPPPPGHWTPHPLRRIHPPPG